MPSLHVETNVKRGDVVNIDAFMIELSKKVAELLNKPEKYVQVILGS